MIVPLYLEVTDPHELALVEYLLRRSPQGVPFVEGAAIPDLSLEEFEKQLPLTTVLVARGQDDVA